MRILGIAGLVLGLALVAYLVVSYLQGVTGIPEAFRAVPGSAGTEQPGRPADLTKRGIEERLAPVLDQEHQRVQKADRAADH